MATQNYDKYKNANCDLGTFVVSVEKFKSRLRPIGVIFTTLIAIMRWKYPFVSMVAVPVTCLMIIFVPEYIMAMFLLPIPLLMVVNLIRKLGSQSSNTVDYHHLFIRKDESPDLLAKRAAMIKAQEHLDLYLNILMEIQEICSDLGGKLEFIHGLLNWKKSSHALLFFMISIGAIAALFCTETKHLIASLFFCACIFNSGFKQAIKDGPMFCYLFPSKLAKSTPQDTKQDVFEHGTIDEVAEKSYDVQMKEQEPFVENDTDSSSTTDSEDYGEKQELKEPSRNADENYRQRERSGLSFVSKFASSTLASITRRRRKAGGNCVSCNVEFSTILKKRNYCRHCGNSYCSKCCNQRVPKVVFGATAPAAYEERVLVCQSCYAFLMNRVKGTNTEIVE